jgi:hypothetical protein
MEPSKVIFVYRVRVAAFAQSDTTEGFKLTIEMRTNRELYSAIGYQQSMLNKIWMDIFRNASNPVGFAVRFGNLFQRGP